jgi:hypothetical protein
MRHAKKINLTISGPGALPLGRKKIRGRYAVTRLVSHDDIYTSFPESPYMFFYFFFFFYLS